MSPLEMKVGATEFADVENKTKEALKAINLHKFQHCFKQKEMVIYFLMEDNVDSDRIWAQNLKRCIHFCKAYLPMFNALLILPIHHKELLLKDITFDMFE